MKNPVTSAYELWKTEKLILVYRHNLELSNLKAIRARGERMRKHRANALKMRLPIDDPKQLRGRCSCTMCDFRCTICKVRARCAGADGLRACAVYSPPAALLRIICKSYIVNELNHISPQLSSTAFKSGTRLTCAPSPISLSSSIS